MAEQLCKMTYANNEPCDREPEHLVHVTCSNPLCRTNDKNVDVPLCTPCLQIVMNRGRSKCPDCSTGMVLTSAPRPINGIWTPHPLPNTIGR